MQSALRGDRKVRCAICGDKNAFRDKRECDFEVRQETYRVAVDSVTCPDCGCTEVVEDPAKIAFAMYRAATGLLTPEEIRGMRQASNFDQSAFTRLTGISEGSLRRYEDGGLQDVADDQAMRDFRLHQLGDVEVGG